MAADGVVCDAIAAADLIVGFGLDPVEIDKTWHAERPIHWLLESPNACGVVPAEPRSSATARSSTRSSTSGRRRRGDDSRPFREFQDKRMRMLTDRRRRPARCGLATSSKPGVGDAAETIVTTDVGSHKYLFGQYWPSREPETFWMSNGLSGMAYGLSAAIGVELARPEAPVLAAVGDGGSR